MGSSWRCRARCHQSLVSDFGPSFTAAAARVRHDRSVNPSAITAQRRRVLHEVARRIPSHDHDCVLVGIDGVDGAGKTVFADHLAHVLQAAGRCVVRISADDFLTPAPVRHHRGRRSPQGFWLDSYDYPALRQRVLDPLGPGGSRRYRRASRDPVSDQPVDPVTEVADPGAVVVVDGLFLHRDDLAGSWDLSVFLDVPFAASVARLAERDGSHPDPEHPSQARYVGGQRPYFAAAHPRERADIVPDVTDPDTPAVCAQQ